MVEQTPKTKRFEGRFPEEARQHFRAAREELREGIRTLLPADFTEHRRKARKEMLLAWRSFIDAALERLEDKSKQA
jgi:hypothetical protein